ncbi:hypothetical protein CC1G_08262 [Coprinopsis cinerea okayama7|uniref:Uncharacterized protein n=1 Tax=Coprinopsis cinerea (strain Okayama-7 / 130 / ATCC MYA-4618 / FGSC 9003) TaxID=240176 RepID=A8PG12_COPC7|nr:hypothetical protein CC1G_08262 [Coprinopsis cinerea okayama7\|eukprot:XP_001841118.2 hypothetical protein CC1G_08262 [Coprinopsis cinerea okayama7\
MTASVTRSRTRGGASGATGAVSASFSSTANAVKEAEAIAEGRTPTCHAPSDAGLALFKALPPNHTSFSSYLVYGFPVNRVLIQSVVGQLGGAVDPHAGMITLTTDLALYLEARIGYEAASFAYYVAKADEQAKNDGIAVDIEGKPHRAVELLAVATTASDKSYRQRPTVKQWKLLEEYLGDSARWFEGMEPKEEFPDYLLENVYKSVYLKNRWKDT